ncbi:hypothetical protein BC830DRAFT_762707 [Chytriomyces sp. MP71]|nr:hypothetical protein BC830DRAFT_762707 [Chytriomyces sp. MP71]
MFLRRTMELWPIMSHFAFIMLRSVRAQMQWKNLWIGWTIIKTACVRSWEKELQFWTQLELSFGIQKVMRGRDTCIGLDVRDRFRNLATGETLHVLQGDSKVKAKILAFVQRSNFLIALFRSLVTGDTLHVLRRDSEVKAKILGFVQESNYLIAFEPEGCDRNCLQELLTPDKFNKILPCLKDF